MRRQCPPFTFKGTVSYIVGQGNVAIIDPGPDDERHIEALLGAVRGETVTHILLTHTHRDHSPAAAAIKAATGAPTYGEGPHRVSRPLHIGEINPLDAAGDMDFRPDHPLRDGDSVAGSGWTLEAITTPGHCANHMAYALKETNSLFSGDHVMGWSTSIVAPPDGAMSDYMASLYKLAKRSENGVFPRPRQCHSRRAALRAELYPSPAGTRGIDPAPARQGRHRYPDLVRAIYIGLDPRLVGAAGLSVLAHLEDLVARGKVVTDGVPSIAGNYRLGDLPLRRLSLLLLGLRRRRLLRRRTLALLAFERDVDRFLDAVEIAADARGIAADVVEAVARGRPHIDARLPRRCRGCGSRRPRESP